MSSSIKLAEYLFTRLRQLGVDSIHGVPGDYNLTLLDYVQPSGLRWVGNANELNAAYAADGYARIKGLGAIVTTFGVGELSAINAIAGAYAEFAPVVHIVGIPVRDAQQSRRLIHHTFNDGEYRRFAAMHAHVTVYQACLNDPRTSAEQIDEALRQCLLHSRPVYIEVPVDMVAKPLSRERLGSPIVLPEAQPNKDEDEVLVKVMNRIYSAKQPLIVVDGETRPLRICEDVQTLVKNTKWPTWSMPFGKGLTDETLDNFHGVYKGCFDDQTVQDFYQGSDLVLFFGPHFSNTNSSNYTTIPKDDAAILFTINGVQIGTRLFRDVSSKNIVSRLVRDLDSKKVPSYTPYPKLPRDVLLPIPDKPTDEILAQDKLWKTLANVIEPGDIILGETGTAGFGVREMAIPQHTRVFTPVTWLSIGYMLPGAQGAALAQKELIEASKYHGLSSAKTILVIGDGSFQMTVQELATMVRHHLNVVVFLINNDGYTIERCIHGRNQEYNDVTPWRYLQAPSFFGAKETTYTGSAKTWRELKEVLEHDGLTKGKELRMVEIFLDRDDCPKGPLWNYMEAQKNGKGVLN